MDAIRQAINSHPNVIETTQLLTMHLAPKQILVNANINLKSELDYPQVVETIKEVEVKIKEAEPKVDMIFLETGTLDNLSDKPLNPKHIG